MLSDPGCSPGVRLFIDGSDAKNFVAGDLAVHVFDQVFSDFESYTIDLNGNGSILDTGDGIELSSLFRSAFCG